MSNRMQAAMLSISMFLAALTLCGSVSAQEATARETQAPASWRQYVLDCMDRCGMGHERREFGLQFDEGVSMSTPADRMVVVVHGFHSDRWHVSQLSSCARQSGLPHAVFEYPNDQRVSDSAMLLSAELQKLKQASPTCAVSLVTHSMGGLVAREALENPQLDPGNVNRLIMVAPPNHGSQLADCNCPLVDAWEYWHSGKQRKEAGLIYGSIEDGLGEAALDLKPSSAFLKRLNARERNAKVKYSILLGNRAPLISNDSSHAPASGKCRWTMSWMAKTWYDDLDEVVNGRGDGVVSLTSGQLDGVRDVAIYPFDHIEVLSEPKVGFVDLVHQAILARLQ